MSMDIRSYFSSISKKSPGAPAPKPPPKTVILNPEEAELEVTSSVLCNKVELIEGFSKRYCRYTEMGVFKGVMFEQTLLEHHEEFSITRKDFFDFEDLLATRAALEALEQASHHTKEEKPTTNQ